MSPAWAATVLLMLVGLISSPLRAADAADLSTPKKAAVAFLKAVEAGDMATVKATSVGNDEDYQFIQSMMDWIDADKRLRAAAVARFGETGSQISNIDIPGMEKQLESGEETINGDTATVGRAGDKDGRKLKMVDGNWKVDLSSTPEREFVGKVLPKMQKVTLDAAADIKAGKYKTVEEAKAAIGQQIFAVTAEQLGPPPQTKPAQP